MRITKSRRTWPRWSFNIGQQPEGAIGIRPILGVRPIVIANSTPNTDTDLAVPIGSPTYIVIGRGLRLDFLRRPRRPIAFLTVDCSKVVYELTYALGDIPVERINGRYAAFR